jgi:GNAT superfamily N-acetyltransferase
MAVRFRRGGGQTRGYAFGMTEDIIIEHRVATSSEHRQIAEAVGWSGSFDWETLPASLEASVSGVVARVGQRVVGMGRLVGDGVKYFYIQDVAVIPECQGQGVGKAIIDGLLLHVARIAPSTAFVGLFSTEQATEVYASRGFTAGDMAGMFRLVEPA